MNPPLTFVINIFNVCSVLTGTSNMLLPMNWATCLPGYFMSYIYPERLCEKYKISQEKLCLIDFCFHWIPTGVLSVLNFRKKQTKRSVISTFMLPILYFSMKQKSNGSFGFVNPINHMKLTYPGVKAPVVFLWYVGGLVPYLLHRSFDKNEKKKLVKLMKDIYP